MRRSHALTTQHAPSKGWCYRPWKPFQILFLCWVLSTGSRALHPERRFTAERSEGKTLAHSHRDESVWSEYSWRQPLHTQFSKQFKDCDDLVLNDKRCCQIVKNTCCFFRFLFSVASAQPLLVSRSLSDHLIFNVTSHSATMRPSRSMKSGCSGGCRHRGETTCSLTWRRRRRRRRQRSHKIFRFYKKI